MARPRKCRKVCCLPKVGQFIPAERSDRPDVIMAVEEYEAIRLIDRQGFSQEACADAMGVARATAQQIYGSARFKLALALVEGRGLRIEGGDYRLCDSLEPSCGCGGCARHRRLWAQQEWKRRSKMKIAVTYENGEIFQHFGHTAQFKLYTVENGQVTASEVVDTAGSGHGALASFLVAHAVEELICGGIGGGAQQALAQAGIKLYAGVAGSADEAVKALLAGELVYGTEANCIHHDHGEHHCGDHGCGDHHCHS